MIWIDRLGLSALVLSVPLVVPFAGQNWLPVLGILVGIPWLMLRVIHFIWTAGGSGGSSFNRKLSSQREAVAQYLASATTSPARQAVQRQALQRTTFPRIDASGRHY